MSQTAKHSPLPWKIEDNLIIGPLDKIERAYPVICEIHGTDKQKKDRSALIIKTVNSHASLVEALNQTEELLKVIASDLCVCEQEKCCDYHRLYSEVQSALNMESES